MITNLNPYIQQVIKHKETGQIYIVTPYHWTDEEVLEDHQPIKDALNIDAEPVTLKEITDRPLLPIDQDTADRLPLYRIQHLTDRAGTLLTLCNKHLNENVEALNAAQVQTFSKSDTGAACMICSGGELPELQGEPEPAPWPELIESLGYATYSPEDNKLRFYADARLDKDIYQEFKDIGYRWAPKQELFYTTWTAKREFFTLQYAEGIEEEKTSRLERAEEREERFNQYADKRAQDAERESNYSRSLTDGIPFGQPILVGHHSEKRHRKAIERAQAAADRALKNYRTSEYWTDRAGNILRHHRHMMGNPRTIHNRIKKIEKNIRDVNKILENSHPAKLAYSLYNHPTTHGEHTPAEAAQEAADRGRIGKRNALRILEHNEHRLAFENALLKDAGGLAADNLKEESKIEKGGMIKSWRGWNEVIRVNKKSITVKEAGNWKTEHSKRRYFTARVPNGEVLDALNKADAAPYLEKLYSDDPDAFTTKTPRNVIPEEPQPAPPQEPTTGTDTADKIKELQQIKDTEVKTTYAPDFYPTPPAVLDLIDEYIPTLSGSDARALEPSAGSGAIADLLVNNEYRTDTIEINYDLNKLLTEKGYSSTYNHDFLEVDPHGTYSIVAMNPPFSKKADIDHVNHAWKFVKPGGRLIAIMASGITFRSDKKTAALRDLIEQHGHIDELPAGSFSNVGTEVNTVLAVMDKPDSPLLQDTEPQAEPEPVQTTDTGTLADQIAAALVAQRK